MARQVAGLGALDARREKPASKTSSTAISVVLHVGLLILMSTISMQMIEEDKDRLPEKVMDAVLIRVKPPPPPPPTPEPAGSESGAGTPVDNKPRSVRPKALARRALNANVSQYKNIVQQQVTRVTPTPVLGQQQVAKVDVAPITKTQAPKMITQRNVQTRTFSELGDIQPYQVSSAPAASNTKLRDTPQVNQTSGPRKMDAAGPVLASSALSYQQPTIANGVVGDVTVQGDPDGPPVIVSEPGSGSGYFNGAGGQGAGSGGGDGNGSGGSGPGSGRGTGGGGSGSGSGNPGPRDCSKDRQCMADRKSVV